MDTPLLEARDLSFAFGSRRVLAGVSVGVKRGEAVAIVGPNGAGKTTLLRCLDGLLRASSGSVRLEGRPVESYPRRELARRMSYVPQAPDHAIPFTVEQFTLMGRYPYLAPLAPIGRDDREAARQAMEWTDTAALADRRMDALSGGERQKVFLAAAVAQGAPVMLLDEPTTFLDYHHQEEIARLLERMRRQMDLTTVSVTHDVNRAALGSDRVIALVEGRVVLDAAPTELMKPDVLAGIFRTPFVLVEHPETAMPMVVPTTMPRETP
ncbi:MAG: ABC transporter ATP-binding protein [Pirellulales bacterium]|nr:ABC transporter ATP-binding protein [Pirellulales bacterium]